MKKWSIELGDYEIKFEAQTSIKGQALADFLAEFHPDRPSNEDEVTEPFDQWLIQTDGGSSVSGCGAGICLVAPTGEVMSQAVRFGFKASNNEVEYEAVLAGLRLAHICGAKNVKLRSDSQLVINHTLGLSEARKENLLKYLKEVKFLAERFEKVNFKHVPRDENSWADSLANISYSESYPWILVQETPSIKINDQGLKVEEFLFDNRRAERLEKPDETIFD